MKKQKVVPIAIVLAFIVVGLGVSALIFGLSGMMGELKTEMAREVADATFASAAGGDDGQVIELPVEYYAQVPDECINMYDSTAWEAAAKRQFEWSSCGYYRGEIERGMVSETLGSDGLPVPVGGMSLTNRGVAGDGFRRWFEEIGGVNKAYPGTLDLVAVDDSFVYRKEKFLPVDDSGGLFTMKFGLPLALKQNGSGAIRIEADDDTWVYAGDLLVLDMGGIHSPEVAQLAINESGELYAAVGDEEFSYTGVRLDGDLMLSVFHANRDSKESVFAIELQDVSLNMVQVELARAEQDGAAIAYDENAAHVAPLGRSLVKQPNTARPLLAAVTIQAFSIGIFAMLLLIVIFAARRYWRRGRNPVK